MSCILYNIHNLGSKDDEEGNWLQPRMLWARICENLILHTPAAVILMGLTTFVNGYNNMANKEFQNK